MNRKITADYLKEAFQRVTANPANRAMLTDVVADDLAKVASPHPAAQKAGRDGLKAFRASWSDEGFDAIVAGSSACQTLIQLNGLAGSSLGLRKR